MDMTYLDKPFYKHMIGTFNGHPATLNLNFGHFTYSGGWALDGTIYDFIEHRMYEAWASNLEKTNYITLSLSEESKQDVTEFQLKGALINSQFKGIALNKATLQNLFFEFHEQYTEGGLALDFGECFFKEEYKGIKSEEDKERNFHVVYSSGMPIIKSSNKPQIYQYLKDSLTISDDCAVKASKFLRQGHASLKEAFEEDTHVRNSDYSVIYRHNIAWNDDNLLVISDYWWDNTAITSYGGQSLDFKTYDLKNNKKLSWSNVFNISEQTDAFDKLILDYLESDNEHLNANITDGFTSKGFYIAATGNHGFYITPILIPYEVVESYLKDDFKKNYWKK